MASNDNAQPEPTETVRRTIQIAASMDDAYAALKNLLSCSATFMMNQWDDSKRTVLFSSFDGIDCSASITERDDGCEVEVVSGSSNTVLAQQHIDGFMRDYQTQIAISKSSNVADAKTNRMDALGTEFGTGAKRILRNAGNRLAIARPVSSQGITERVRQANLVVKIIAGMAACILLIVFACVIGSCGGDSTPNDGKISVPESSTSFEDDNYKDVVDRLKSAGFTNIKTEGLGDLITGFLHKEGEVKEVSVGGDVDYSTSDRFSPSVKIVVRYHSYPKHNDSADQSGTDDADSSGSSDKAESQDATTGSSSDNQGKTDDGSSSESSTEAQGIINAQNNQEFAQLLTGNDSSQAVESFANKYQGKDIEFDGYTSSVTRHGSYKTRFDYLILAGDVGNTQGPNFHFSNVNYYDLHLTGDNVPDSFTTNLNIHVVAKIKSYDSASDLLELEPVSITMR